MQDSALRSLKHKLVVAGLKLPDRARKPYGRLLGWSKTAVSTLLSLVLPIYALPCEESNGSSRIGYVGAGNSLDYVAHLACGRGGAGEPVAHTSLFAAARAVRQLGQALDVVVVELPRSVLSVLFRSHGFLVSPWVRWQVDTRRPWPEIERTFHRTSVRSDLKKLEESRIECVRTQERAAFECFYWEHYRPSMLRWHGDLAEPTPFELLESTFSAGWLTLYVAGGETIGGSVQYVAGNVLYDYVMGCAEGISRRQQTLVTIANYYNALRSACEFGCRAVDLGLTRPLLNDGLARYKRKWGSTLVFDGSQNWAFWISVPRKSATAIQFLAQNPWIWVDRDGTLKGLLVVDDADGCLSRGDVERICRSLWAPGLFSILVYAPCGFRPGMDLVPGPVPALGPAFEWRPVAES